MSRDYEMALIVDTQVDADATIDRYASLLADQGAAVVNVDRWGVRRLAYEIQKRQQGDYTFFYFQADPGAIADVERACRLDEDVLRHLILQTDIPPQAEEEEDAEEVSVEEDGDE
ncbi:MAG: 30S ribosomal protein S6 [Gemmatimonadetes bacterium]|nr:30S ribosomal protein S6 [Gemmatimonadota bacterium]MYB59179.1 30S ribosomal protein S6 [Gemmatimonadota bacterium]MYD60188.1 30S ribosomal protein S6 [Gemmatimonadota bacterium]